jgi:uncharacterized OB-fold protein
MAPETRPFWQALGEHRLELQVCANCRSFIHYPRSRCPRCWSAHLEWREASGRARLRSYTVIHRPGHPAWEADVPYVVALVELDEGPCLLSNVIDVNPEDLCPGLPLAATFVNDGELTLVKFVSAAETAGREIGVDRIG